MPWELGLAETQQVLMLNNLRDRIIVQVDGQLKTGRDVVIAALLGAEEFGFATAPLVVSGCIMMRVCHLNTCPVGIATQDPELRKKFTGKPEFVENYFRFVAEEVRELMAELGFRTIDEMVGRVDRLDIRAGGRSLEGEGPRPLAGPASPAADTTSPRRRTTRRITGWRRRSTTRSSRRRRRDRAEGAGRSALPDSQRQPHHRHPPRIRDHAAVRCGGLPDDTIRLQFTGSAGQSFGAFVPSGVTMNLEGDANDFVGKGLSGGKLIVHPLATRPSRPSTTSSSATSRSTARPVARRTSAASPASGSPSATAAPSPSWKASAITAARYMTAGRVVVLGRTGRNFAAGMSGGIAYVLDVEGRFAQRCNRGLVDLETLEETKDIEMVLKMLRCHVRYTESSLAAALLANWSPASS